jgi:hypothetical protein
MEIFTAWNIVQGDCGGNLRPAGQSQVRRLPMKIRFLLGLLIIVSMPYPRYNIARTAWRPSDYIFREIIQQIQKA